MSLSSTWSTEQFDKEYATLDPLQKQGVDTLEGPLLVLGAPGTGKTKLLVVRIAHLLLKTTTALANILCLCPTQAAAIALSKRLERLTGPGVHTVPVYTFPGLCEAIMKDNPSFFETSNKLPLSDLERIQLLTRLIDAFPKGHPLKRYRGDVYFEVNNLLSLFSTMRQEGWTSDHISEQIDAWLHEFPPESQSNEEDNAAANRRMEKLRAAAHEFHNYQELLRHQNRYEVDDVTGWVIKALEDNPSLLQQYQQRFTHLLIDDYQQLNSTQLRLIALLTGDQSSPNICVTANDPVTYPLPEALTRFAAQYKETLVTILLNQSLSAALRLPHVREYETAWQEMIGITLQVQQLLQQGISPASIGVLCKEPAYRQQLAPYLKLAGIPVHNHYPVNVFEVPLAQQLFLLFHYLAAEQDIPHSGDEILFELLHAEWFNIPSSTIIQLTIRLSEKSTGDRKPSLRRLLYEKVHTPPMDLFTPPVHEGLKRASNAVELLTGMASHTTLPILFESMVRETGITSFINQHPDRLWLQQVITALSDCIQQETQRNPSLQLQEWSKLLTLMQWQQIPLLLLQSGGHDKGIGLFTMEEAREQPFEYIFLAGCNATYWENSNARTRGYQLPASLSPIAATNEEPLPRAQHLVFSYSRTGQDLKPTPPAAFLTAIITAQILLVEKVVLQPELMSLFRLLFQNDVMAPEISKPDEALVNRMLEKFMLSATALNNYLYCPLGFFYHNLVRVPSRRNEATEFGSAIHHALEMLFRNMQANEEAFPSRAAFINDFDAYMHRQRGSFTPEQFNRRIEYGHEVLSNYYDEYIHSWSTIVAVERNFRNVIVSGVPLKGKIDKLEFDGRMVNIVDYKTGDPDRAKAQMAPPGEAMPLGGNYWRQAVFYKILVDNYRQKEWKVASSELDLIEPDKQQQYHKEKFFITGNDVTVVTQQIVNTWWRIQNRDFYTGCGKPGCYWCHFVKTNHLSVAWHLQST